MMRGTAFPKYKGSYLVYCVKKTHLYCGKEGKKEYMYLFKSL